MRAIAVTSAPEPLGTGKGELCTRNRKLYQEAHETGAPLIRAMFFEFPEDAKCWKLQDQYMFGDRFLVAPVLELHAKEREVYLPAGRWKDVNSGRITDGGQTLTVQTPLDEIPVFEKI